MSREPLSLKRRLALVQRAAVRLADAQSGIERLFARRWLGRMVDRLLSLWADILDVPHPATAYPVALMHPADPPMQEQGVGVEARSADDPADDLAGDDDVSCGVLDAVTVGVGVPDDDDLDDGHRP